MNTRQKNQKPAPKKIKRSEKDRRQLFTFDHFFNPENEKRENIKDRRREMSRPRVDLNNIFL